MKTFAIRGNDVVLAPGGFAMVSGPAKVYQDLSVAVREPIGNDRFHPGWGSLMSQFVGLTISDELNLRIRSEITRVVANYIFVQHESMVEDSRRGTRSRFSPAELVERVQAINIVQEFDRLHVSARIETIAGEMIDVATTVNV